MLKRYEKSESKMKKIILFLCSILISFTHFSQCIITSQPLSQQFCQNTPASPLTISVDDVNATFQWYSNTVNSNTGGTPILGATSSSFTPSSSNAGTFFYYCIISGCSNLTSDVAGVIVNPIPVITNSPPNGMAICGAYNGYPVNQYFQTNFPSYLSINSFYANASGSNPTQSFNGILNDNISYYGVGIANYQITPISYFGCSGVTHILTITGSSPATIQQPLGDIEICSGNSLNIALNNNNGNTYVWGAQSNSNVTGESSSQSSSLINDVLINTTSVNQVVLYFVTPYSPQNSICPTYPGETTFFSVTVKPAPILNVSDVTICSGATAQLIGNGTPSGGAYLWSGSGLSSPTNQQSQITVSPTTTTSYSASYTVNGCTTSDNVNVTVVQNPTASVNNSIICNGDSATLVASPAGGIYSWSDGTNIIGSGQTITVNPTITTNYTVTVIVAGCSTITATSTVTVNQTPTVSVNNSTICSGSQATLIAIGSPVNTGTYLWSTFATSASINVNPTNTTNYTVIYTLNGCASQPVSTEVTVNPIPTLNVSDTTICGGVSVQLAGNGSPSSGTYLWSGPNLSAPSNQQSQITVSPTTTTSYSVSYTVNGCVINDNVTVSVNPIPIFNYFYSSWLCGTIDSLNVWVNQPGSISTSEISNGINYNSAWIYNLNSLPELNEYITFTFTNSLNGCTYTDSTYINTLQNFISDQVIDTTIHPCQYFGQLQLPNNDYWIDTSLNSPYEYIINNWNGNDFVHFNNYPNGYENTTLIGYTETPNGCLVDTININFFADTSGSNSVFSCGDNAIQLNGNQGINADSMVWTSWYNGISINFNNSSNLNALYYPNQAEYDQGFVIFSLEAFYPHCLFQDTSVLYISLGANVYTGNDTTICAHSPIVINSSGVNSTVWNSGNVDGDIVVLDSGNYQFIVTGYSGYNNFCISTDTLNILVNALPNIDAGLDVAICFGDSALLNASSNSLSNIAWSNGAINLSYFNPLTSQSLIASVTENNCSNSDTLNITVNPNPQVNAGPDVFICEGDSVVLQGTGATFLEWTNSILNSVPFVPNQSDTFVLNGEDTNGCIGVDSLTISVYPHSDTTIIESSIGNYTWDVNNQTYSESGVYTGVVTNQFGCDSTITLNLTITTSSLEDSFGFTIVEIYPNPVVSQLNVVVDQSSIDSEYTITDMSGKIIMKGTVNAKQFQIDMSRLENGSYLIGVGGKLKVLVKQG